jgi:hypothetical protein
LDSWQSASPIMPSLSVCFDRIESHRPLCCGKETTLFRGHDRAGTLPRIQFLTLAIQSTRFSFSPSIRSKHTESVLSFMRSYFDDNITVHDCLSTVKEVIAKRTRVSPNSRLAFLPWRGLHNTFAVLTITLIGRTAFGNYREFGDTRVSSLIESKGVKMLHFVP